MSRRSNDAAGIFLLIGALFGFLWSLFKYPVQTIIGLNVIVLIFFPDYLAYVLIPSLIIGLVYYYSKKSTEQESRKKVDKEMIEKYGKSEVDKTKTLTERNDDIIRKFYDNLRKDNWPHYIENKTSDCIKDIAAREGQPRLAPQYREWLPIWEKRTGIPKEWIELKNNILEKFKQRYKEILVEEKTKEEKREREYKEQQDKEGQIFYNQNQDLIDKFLDIAERKVSVIDDYGDENWDLLPSEINACITKIAKRNGHSDGEIKDFLKNGYTWKLGEEYSWLKEKLRESFEKHHQNQKHKPHENHNLNSLSGIDFETHIARLLRDRGYNDVRGTATTGDQGADLIVKKDGRTIVIQAKRYQGTVGNKAVQEVIAAVKYYNGDEGWVVTNSTFTPSAKALAQKSSIRLIDGYDLSNNKL